LIGHKTTYLAGAVALALLSIQPAAQAAVTTYSVTQNYNQVVYDLSHPDWDTIFNGSFTFDSVTRTVSNLTGSLSQAMDGNTTWVSLTHQLSTVADGPDGLIVTVFKNDTTATFIPSDTYPYSGGNFGSNGVMGGYAITDGSQNAFATIYVPLADPATALTQSQIDKLAYADCTPAALMPRNGSGTKCMAGWVAYTDGVPGPGGTMKGTWPITQTIAAVPEPETYAMLMAGLGLVGLATRRRTKN
jgi:hypothetical protein